MYLAAAEGAVFGVLGAGGLALVLTTFLILGVRGKGKVKLKDTQAAIVAFLAASSYVAAGKIWSSPQQVVEQGLTGLGVGGASGPFGEVGIGAVALLLLIVMLTASLTSVFGATVGMIAGFVWPAAGDGTIWAVPSQLAAAVLMMVGG